VQTGGVAGAFAVADNMMKQPDGNISPPNHQALTQQPNYHLPPQPTNYNLPPQQHYHQEEVNPEQPTKKSKKRAKNNNK
jgi:hypothetical protein